MLIREWCDVLIENHSTGDSEIARNFLGTCADTQFMVKYIK